MACLLTSLLVLASGCSTSPSARAPMPVPDATPACSPGEGSCTAGGPGCDGEHCPSPNVERAPLPATPASMQTPTPRARPRLAFPTPRPIPSPLPRASIQPTAGPGPPTPAPSRRPAPVVIAAGDIADCGVDGDEQTATLLDGLDGTIVTLGDNVYEHGTPREFQECYDPSWGRHRDRTRPSIGNHEYGGGTPAGYFGYFGPSAGDPSAGYYSYNLEGWHVVVLNSMCNHAGGCGPTDPQARWLERDLAANAALCTLAYWHHPLFTSGSQGPSTWMRRYWDILYAAGVDVVLNGHDHHYERFARMAPTGQADPLRGIRTFIVGTGGKSLLPIHHNDPLSEVRQNHTFGVLVLTLRTGLYEWRFVPVAGGSFADSGADRCH